MSFFGFNLVGNALDAYSQAQNVTADNIANVATPGASRQSADITEAIPISGSPFYASHLGSPGTRGEGAVVNQIARLHQNSFDGLFRSASSSQYFYSTSQQQLSSLQSNFGEPNNGINSAYAGLQTAVSNAASSTTTAADSASRQAVLTQAQTFSTALNSASAAIGQQEQSALSQGASVVKQANTLIDQIAALNGQIRSLSATGDNPNTYLDQRDYAIDQLSQIIPTTTTNLENGSSLVSVDGRPLVNDTIAYHLAAPVVGKSTNGTPTYVVGFENDPSLSDPVPIPLGSGQLGAFADTYNNKLAPYGQQLDNFASAAASEMNRITQAGVDKNSNVGTALFTATAGQQITAGSISVAITDPTQLPLGLISTSAGSLTQAMNSANNTVSTAVALDGNVTLLNPPPAAGLSGSLSVAVDGTTQTFSYSTAAGGNAATMGGFMTSFNTGHYGVTASFDVATQTIDFARDPNNIDVVHRALQAQNAPTPGFTISDSLGPAGTTPPSAALGAGTPATGLLQALGATNINGVAQTPQNAYGTADNGAANALIKLFTQNVGVGALQSTAVVAPSPSAAPGLVTIAPPAASPTAFTNVSVGQVLTIVNAAAGTQQNVSVAAVNLNTGTISVNALTAITSGDAITTAQSQTLGAAYQSLVTQMGLDAHTATTGASTQTALASSIDAARQSVDGINIDEETQNLLKFQSAYAAAAKTLSTLNAMMQTTLGLITGG